MSKLLFWRGKRILRGSMTADTEVLISTDFNCFSRSHCVSSECSTYIITRTGRSAPLFILHGQVNYLFPAESSRLTVRLNRYKIGRNVYRCISILRLLHLWLHLSLTVQFLHDQATAFSIRIWSAGSAVAACWSHYWVGVSPSEQSAMIGRQELWLWTTRTSELENKNCLL